MCHCVVNRSLRECHYHAKCSLPYDFVRFLVLITPETCKSYIVHGCKTKHCAWSWAFRHFADVEVCLLSDQVTKPLLSLFKRELEEDYAAQSLLA